jgi:hypothetical protein
LSFRSTYRSLVIIIILVVAVSSCGYSVRKAPAYTEVRIGEIKNLSFEPALQDSFIMALERELTRRGVRVDRGAEHAVEGELKEVKVKGTAEADDVMVQYEIAVSGSFSLTGPEGTSTPLGGGQAFIVTFGGAGTLEELMASRESALESALMDLASEVAASVAGGR